MAWALPWRSGGPIGGRNATSAVVSGASPPPISFSTVATFGYVCIAWVLFRAPNLTVAREALAGLVGIGTTGTESVARWVGVYLAVAAVLHWMSARRVLATWIDRLTIEGYAAAIGVSVAVILALQPVGASPFIYFQF